MPNNWFPKLRAPTQKFAVCFLTVLLGASAARAQITLPGAAAPTEEGAVATPVERAPHAGEGKAAAKPRLRKHVGKAVDPDERDAGSAIAPKPPSEDGVLGKALYLDGSRSSVELDRAGGRLEVTKLTLTGDSITHSGESCRVEVSGMPLRLDARDNDAGLHRYQADLPACPFVLDVLDGAILVTNQGGACELKAADCRSDPVGLWGVGASDLDMKDPKRAKEMLASRARIEKTVRADFRALYAKYKKDKPLRQYLVREQAGFSAHREEICRAYAQEADFGYCALRVTEARALTLGTQLAHGVVRPANLIEEAPPKRPRRAGK